jgi:Ferric reductase NAD binding domain
VLWLLSIIVVVYRHVRNGYPFTVLASYVGGREYAVTASLDFIYATPTAADDEWLVRELEEMPATKRFRLHRFLTREKPDEEGADPGEWGTNYGRPNFNEIFENVVRNSAGEESVGVFFCGPRRMEQDVREACFRAMMRSRRRGSFFTGRCKRRGCNVRLLVRAENFG